MTYEYNVDEFIGINEPTEYDEEVEKKINLLYDWGKIGVVHKKKVDRYDSREDIVRKMLQSCNSLVTMDNIVRDILAGKCTVNDMLKRKGFL